MKLVCINCPRGCRLEVENINGEIKVTGNSCPRGEQYAVNEMTNPLRTVTTTIGIISKNYNRLPVITSAPIPKAKIMDVCKALKDVEVKTPIRRGDVIISNILDLESDIIASKTIEE